MRQLYEFEEQIEDLSHGLKPITRSLWKYRRQVTVEQLGNALQQATESTDDSQHKVLRRLSQTGKFKPAITKCEDHLPLSTDDDTIVKLHGYVKNVIFLHHLEHKVTGISQVTKHLTQIE